MHSRCWSTAQFRLILTYKTTCGAIWLKVFLLTSHKLRALKRESWTPAAMDLATMQLGWRTVRFSSSLQVSNLPSSGGRLEFIREEHCCVLVLLLFQDVVRRHVVTARRAGLRRGGHTSSSRSRPEYKEHTCELIIVVAH